MRMNRTLILSLGVTGALGLNIGKGFAVSRPSRPAKSQEVAKSAAESTSIPSAEIWEFQKVQGERVGLLLRYSVPDDNTLGTKLFSHRMLGDQKMALLGVQSPTGDFIPWGDQRKAVEFWKDLERQVKAVYDEIEKQKPQNLPGSVPDPKKPLTVKHANILLTEVDVSSEAIHASSGFACIIYQVFPNKVTAAGCVATTGMVMFDELGGGEGVRYVGTGFLGLGPGMVVPKNPKRFGENVVKTAINPFKQAKLYEKALRPIVGAVPGAKQVVNMGRQGMKVVGDVQILGTTPSHALASWQKNPVEAAKKTIQCIGETKIGHTTIGHAANSWATDPVGALGKTLGF